MKKPNIVFIFSDQQRHDTLGCYDEYSKEINVTPNLDKLAEEGVLFESSFTCQPVCGPARACLQTGVHATETGCYINGISLPITNKNIANYFSNSGYEVGYIGKWHLASTILRSKEVKRKKISYRNKPIPPERRGGYKDFWLASDILEFTSHGYDGYLFDGDMNKVEFKGYRVDCLTDFAIDYLDTREGKKPFFLFISYLEPHHQNDRNVFEGPVGSKEKFKDFKVPGDLEGTRGNWRENFPDYLGCCNSIDMNAKRIQNKLEELEISDNTIIFFTSDHGCHFRTRNDEYKRSCHEATVHVPLIIKGPGFEGGKRVSELVSLIDLPPTLLRAAGIDIPEQMRGRPLQELINGNASNWQQDVFIQISESHVGRAIRTKKWKYSVRAPNMNGYLNSHSDSYMEDFLYDLENDIHERNNLVKDPEYAGVRAELAEILKRRMKGAGEEVPIILQRK